jgi:two-component system NtrC family sensor kinase
MSAGRVLVVDDEPGVLTLCSRLLAKAGYEAVPAESAAAGLRCLEREPFDLLLVDIRMPEMDGFALIREAREAQPDLAIVIMTGFGTVETAVRALEEGATGLVLKPFESNQTLLRQVQLAIENTRARREAARSRFLQPLFDLAETLFSETEESRLAGQVASAVRGQLDCQAAALYVKEEAGALRLLSRLGEAPLGAEPGADDPATAAADQLVVLRLALKDRDLPAQVRTWLEGARLAAVLCVPVRRSQGTYVVVAGRGQEGQPFSESEQELLVLLARQAAVALENARLYGALRAYVQEIERSQQRLVQTEKLAAIGRLTASIAHEVNNPLQSLRNCLDLAGREGIEEDRQREYLRLAQKELDQLSWIVRQMLEFYRPEAAARTPVDVNQIVRAVASLTEGQCRSCQVEVTLELTPSIPAVWAVGFQLQQVALNLVLNALDAMPEGGALLIGTQVRQGRVQIRFSDTGRGIPRQDLTRIFEPFYTSKEGGTGLGLAISYGIVSAHGGSIEVESDPGVGSTFRVLLPAAEKE